MKTIWRKKKIIGAGAICLTLVGGCTARAPHVPSGAAATARQAQTVGQQAEAALPQAATARAEPSGQRVEAGMNQFASRASETLSEREVRRFKKISTHEHFRTGGDIKPYLAAMKRANIEKAVFVPTAWPPSNPQSKENLQELLALQRQYPKKIIVFATAYNKDPKAAMILEEALKSGAQGIKFIDWLASAKYPDDAGPVDSPNMYRVYEIARRHRIPVLMHIDFQKRPEWKVQFERAATDFPDVTFILAHYCRAASGLTPALDLCADTLDKFPQVVVDMSMGGGLKRYMRYFDADPQGWREFVLRYQDRLFWGTDTILDGNPNKDAAWVWHRMLTDFVMFQSTFYQSPFHQEDKTLHRGLALPASVLRKIYYDNPQRLLFNKSRIVNHTQMKTP